MFFAAQIALSALAIAGGLLLTLRGYQRAGDAVEKVLDGQWAYWGLVALWLALAFCGGGLAAAVPTYWLDRL